MKRYSENFISEKNQFSPVSIIPSMLHVYLNLIPNTGRFIMFSVITNIYNKKTRGPTLMELSQTQEN
jgi:hypothetical protein